MAHIPQIPPREDLSPGARDGSPRPDEGPPASGAPRDAQPRPGEAREGPPSSGAPRDAQPHDAQPHDAQPHDAQPHDAQPHDAQPRREPREAPAAPGREPALMLPASIVAALAVLVLVQVVRGQLGWRDDIVVLAWFAFIPARYADTFGMFPGGVGADLWTFLSYALLHGSWMHLVTNAIWLTAFGSAVARRFGALRFFAFCAVTAAAGAGVHLAAHFGDPTPVVGASAAIAGLMAAAARFVFEGRGPLVVGAGGDNAAFRRPARSLPDTLRNPRAAFFVLVFFGINLLTGVGSNFAAGVTIAWEAHIGGFLAGLLLFRAFDPVRR